MQETEYQNEQTELEGKIAVAEMGTKKKFQMQLHAQLGKLWTGITKKKMNVLKLNSMSLYLLLGMWHVTFLTFLGHRVKCESCYLYWAIIFCTVILVCKSQELALLSVVW